MAALTKNSINIFGSNLKKINRKINHSKVKVSSMDLGPYDHFMQKEIYEQPRALGDTIEAVIDNNKFNDSLFGNKAKEVLSTLIKIDSRINQDPEPFIAVSELGDSSVNIAVRVWVEASDYWGVYFAMNENVYKIFDKEGLSIPYPQVDVHVQNN